MNLDKIIQSRKSVRNFKGKKPDWRDIIECIDSVRYAPMAGNNFSLKFIIVSDAENILKISEASQQPFISQAKYVIIVCSDTTRTINAFGKKGEVFVRQQAGAAIENLLLKLHEKGLSTCWIGHFIENHIKKILTIPDKIQIEALFPIGYENKIEKRKTKIELDRFLYFEKFGNKKMNKIKKLEI